MQRLIGHDTDAPPIDPSKTNHDVGRKEGVYLQKVAIVKDSGDHLMHVIWLVGGVRDQLVKIVITIVRLEPVLHAEDRGILEIVCGRKPISVRTKEIASSSSAAR